MLLFIGSTVADVVIRLPRLPRSGEDLHVQTQHASLGGCAYNAFRAAEWMGAEARLFSPVGGGIWGDFVRRACAVAGVTGLIDVPGDNGCCYCLVEEGGERTFLCEHGAEYVFRRDWFDLLTEDYTGVYVCGLEIEEPTGEAIISYLEDHAPRRLYFAPGPRIGQIPPDRMARLMALHPLMHLNADEALQYTGCGTVAGAAAALFSMTDAPVIVTLGAEGAWVQDEAGGRRIDGYPAQVADTIGAGDAHIGAVMACLDASLPLEEAVRRANRLSAAVVSLPGATLPASPLF